MQCVPGRGPARKGLAVGAAWNARTAAGGAIDVERTAIDQMRRGGAALIASLVFPDRNLADPVGLDGMRRTSAGMRRAGKSSP